jgi:hypothetical protein
VRRDNAVVGLNTSLPLQELRLHQLDFLFAWTAASACQDEVVGHIGLQTTIDQIVRLDATSSVLRQLRGKKEISPTKKP